MHIAIESGPAHCLRYIIFRCRTPSRRRTPKRAALTNKQAKTTIKTLVNWQQANGNNEHLFMLCSFRYILFNIYNYIYTINVYLGVRRGVLGVRVVGQCSNSSPNCLLPVIAVPSPSPSRSHSCSCSYSYFILLLLLCSFVFQIIAQYLYLILIVVVSLPWCYCRLIFMFFSPMKHFTLRA